MTRRLQLTRSIAKTVALYFLFFLLYYLFATRHAGTPLAGKALSIGIILTYHVLITLFLLFRRKDFVYLSTGMALSRVNAANRLTIFRACSVPALVLLLVKSVSLSVRAPLIVLTVLTFLSDFLDGRISRRARQKTRIGGYLDSSTDYLVLLSLSVGLVVHGLVSAWLFALVVIRFCAQGIGILLLWARHKRVREYPTTLGKASVFATMVLFATSLLQLAATIEPYYDAARIYLEIGLSVILIASLVEKSVLWRRSMRKS